MQRKFGTSRPETKKEGEGKEYQIKFQMHTKGWRTLKKYYIHEQMSKTLLNILNFYSKVNLLFKEKKDNKLWGFYNVWVRLLNSTKEWEE